jgi:hypothetical protein
MALFDLKNWNADVFQRYMRKVPNLKKDAIIKSGAVVVRQSLAVSLKEGVGGNYIEEPMKAPIGGDSDNYDGATDITTDSRDTYTQGKIVIGRAHGWTEKDFSSDITGGEDFMPVATEVSEYFSLLNEGLLLSTLKGIFASTDTSMTDFVDKHTYDITADADPTMSTTTLNSCTQKALGDNKNKFALAIMHSSVATQLENKQLITFFVYNDAKGMQRDATLYSWNGKPVIVTDDVPVTTGAGGGSVYTTYVFGKGAIEYTDVGVKVPYEMDRDPAKNGGETTLYARERVVLAPVGISFALSPRPISPLNAQLESATAWKLASNNDATSPKYYPHKNIAIARILSK